MKKTKFFMKRYHSAIVPMAFAGAVVISAMGGCQKEFLQPDPLSFFSPEETFTTQSGLMAAMAISDRHMRYIMMKSRGLATSCNAFQGGDLIFSDIMCTATTDNVTWTRDFYTQVTPNSGRYDGQQNALKTIWSEQYVGIKYANAIPTYIGRIQGMDEALKNEYLGRAYFHRALKYYTLIGHHGDVPLITKIPSAPKFNYRTCKKEAIIKKMIVDLEFALQHVPGKDIEKRGGAVNRGAVRMLLAKYYLYDNQAAKAKEQLDQLIDHEGYALVRGGDDGMSPPDNELYLLPNTEKTWRVIPNVIWWLHRPENKGKASNTEAILICPNQGAGESVIEDVQYMRTLNPWLDGHIKTPDGKTGITFFARSNAKYRQQYDYARAFGRGIANYRPSFWYEGKDETSVWYVNNHFTSSDLRRSSAVGNWFTMDSLRYNDSARSPAYYGRYVQHLDANGNDLADNNSMRCWYGYPHYKTWFRDLYCEANVNASDVTNGSYSDWQGRATGSVSDIYIFRLAEAYLLRAEANLYLGNAADATNDVNEIRKRAGCGVADLYSSVGIGDIMDERARELYHEEWRNAELKRVSHCLALYGTPDEWGNVYNLDNYDKQSGDDLSGGSYWYARVTKKGMYKGAGVTYYSNQVWGTFFYRMGKQNHYYPIPQDAIDANRDFRLAQNYGYDGYDASAFKWSRWEDAVADEDNY
jgi:hypothetical protein